MRFHPRLSTPRAILLVLAAALAPATGHAAPQEDLVGIEIEGVLGEELGQVSAVSEKADGDAVLLVEASGMLDLGHAVFTVRRSQLKPGPADDVLTYPVTAADIRRQVHDANRVAAR